MHKRVLKTSPCKTYWLSLVINDISEVGSPEIVDEATNLYTSQNTQATNCEGKTFIKSCKLQGVGVWNAQFCGLFIFLCEKNANLCYLVYGSLLYDEQIQDIGVHHMPEVVVRQEQASIDYNLRMYLLEEIILQ